MSAHTPLPMSAYEELLVAVRAQGLFKRTYWFYALSAAVAITGMAASLYALSLSDSMLFQALNAVVFAFFSVQIGMLGHDLSHGQVFESRATNRFMAMVVWGFFSGLSESRWFTKHNAHHKNPNHIGHDPDLEIPFVFSDVQAEKRSFFYKRYIFPYQHILFWPALSFVYPYNIGYSMKYFYRNPDLRSVAEFLLIILHFVIVVGLPLYFLPIPAALVFLVVAFFLIGAYIGMVFAPNHKGEEMLSADEPFNWTHQITLTRNLYSSWPTFYIFGGLNFQIEHHLFPTMSRLQYFGAHTLVEDFCARHGIRYHQTSLLGSMREIHLSLKEEAQEWKKK
jgi:fatty acid desaturase